MKKLNKKLVQILILSICIICIFSISSYADVGSFEDYGGGSSWGGGSWDSGSSWDSSYSSGGNFIFFGGGSFWTWLIIMAIIIAINVYRSKHPRRPQNYNYTPNYQTQSMSQLEQKQTQIENQIQVSDANFNKEEFIAWSKNLFIKLQQAWTARDWETIRAFETENLFEQHKNQLQGYINNKQINVMDRICVNYAHLYHYTKEGDKEILTVRLNSRMADYIIDETTSKVLKGDKQTERVNTYLLTFIRKDGVKTMPGTIEVNTTNCPNCGAPTLITSSGKCEYCGSVLTTGEYNWVLSNLERERT
ncbi:MAG: TIM44-like domain-containing protein [Clostridia bacterium]|jgi:hypothetical protein|nr:TIM44-like domain-containing protein [Clostridia bacterium]